MLLEKQFYPRGKVYTKRMMKCFLLVFKLNAKIFQTPVLWKYCVYQSLIPDNTSKSTTANICLTCKFQPPQHDLSHMVPMLTVPEVSFSQPASSSLPLQTLQQAPLLNRCNLPNNR